MKYNGEEISGENTEEVEIVKGSKRYVLKVCALPFGWRQSMQTKGVFTRPVAPMVHKRDAVGTLYTDSDNNILTYPDEDNPEYEQKWVDASELIDCVLFAQHLRIDPNVTFDTQIPTDGKRDSWAKYGKEMQAEVKASKFTEEEVQVVLEAGARCAFVIDIVKTADVFLETPTTQEEA